MQQERVKLRLREPVVDPEVAGDPRALIERAIAGHRLVRATYNRDAIELAPHALYLKHDEAYVDGVVHSRNGAPPREAKLGAFKLAGLGGLAPTIKRFETSGLFHKDAERYSEALIASV